MIYQKGDILVANANHFMNPPGEQFLTAGRRYVITRVENYETEEVEEVEEIVIIDDTNDEHWFSVVRLAEFFNL